MSVAFFDKAVEIQADYFEAWYNRGVVLGYLKRYKEAIASYDKAVEINPDSHEAWHNRGNALVNLSQYQEAIASYDKALKIEPKFHLSWTNRGNVLARLSRFEEAIASHNKAVEIKPNLDETWGYRGVTLINLGSFKEALQSFNQALKLNPDKPIWYYNKACCYALQNNVRLAIENLQKAISIDEKYRDIANTDRDFDKIREDIHFQELQLPQLPFEYSLKKAFKVYKNRLHILAIVILLNFIVLLILWLLITRFELFVGIILAFLFVILTGIFSNKSPNNFWHIIGSKSSKNKRRYEK